MFAEIIIPRKCQILGLKEEKIITIIFATHKFYTPTN